MTLRDLERNLRRHGCVFFREAARTRKITRVPRRREIKERTARGICKQLEIPRP